MSRMRQYSLEEKADISGFCSQVPESLSQLKSGFNHHIFLTALGNFAFDDPSKVEKLALASCLRENKHARNNPAWLHTTRLCLYIAGG